MSGTETETVPILVNATAVDCQVHSALSNEEEGSSEEDHLIPEVVFSSVLDSPGINRESQPLLGPAEVSYNHFPGECTQYLTIYLTFHHFMSHSVMFFVLLCAK